MTNLDSILKRRDITLPTNVSIVKAIVFPVAMYRCESWTTKKDECWRTDALNYGAVEDSFDNPLDRKVKPVHPKGNQFSIFIGRTDTEADALILEPPDAKRWLIGKDPDDGKDWRQNEKGITEDEMVGQHHRPDVHEFEQTPGDREGQGSLACYSPWSHKESDTT